VLCRHASPFICRMLCLYTSPFIWCVLHHYTVHLAKYWLLRCLYDVKGMPYVQAMSVCPSILDPVSAAKPFVGLAWNLVYEFFTISCEQAEFHAAPLSGSHTLIKGSHFYHYFPHFLVSLVEIQYWKALDNPIQEVWVWWKLVQETDVLYLWA
jgi:hypothetical protein